ETGRQAYARFCSALAARYADKEIIWELWNEPDLDQFWTPLPNVDDYMVWCRTVTPVIRQHDRDACIVAPAVSGFDFAFLESCFAKGLLELVDGVSVHPYRNARLGPESALPEYEMLKIMIEEYRPTKKQIPILSGEWGYSTAYLSPELQGNYLARQWLSNMAASVPVSIWYDWHDDGQDPKNPEHNFGTVTWDYKVKPAYTAMKTLTRQLNGWTPQGRIDVTDENDFVLLFTQKDGIKLAVWTIADPHLLDLGANMRIGTAVDQDGAVQEMNAHSLTLTQRPLYLTLAEPPSGWMKFLVTAIQADKALATKTIASFLAGSTGKDDGALLHTAIDGGSALERRAAAQALRLLADKLEPDQAICQQLLQRLLMEPIGVLNQKQLLYRLSRGNQAALLPEVKPLLHEPSLMEAASSYILAAAFQKAREKNSASAKEWLALAAPYSPHRYAVDRVLKAMEAAGTQWDAASLSAISRQAGFINHWWIAGPFPNVNNQAEKIAYFPERRIDFSQVQLFDSLTAS
ncbi:cellulase family glycosylhydrolase, partial [bacterium]|nr:cellulase family glycosylhydrolase [bacterium]